MAFLIYKATLCLASLLMSLLLQQALALGKLPVFQERVVPDDVHPGTYSGCSVAITPSGTRSVIGLPSYQTNKTLSKGSTVVYDLVGSSWTKTATLQNSNPDSVNQGGVVTVSQDGNTICSSDQWYNSYMGALFVFHFNGTAWDGGVEIISPNPVESSRFATGQAISLDGNTIVASQADYTVGAYVYVRSGVNSWEQQGSRLETNVSSGFISSRTNVALSANGDLLVFGAMHDLSDQGSSFFFKRNSSKEWNQSGPKLTLSGTFWFGRAVALSADGAILLVTSYGTQAAVFQLDQQEETFDFVQTLTVTGKSNNFGLDGKISTDGTRVVIGDSKANSVQLPQGNNRYTYYTGGAFIFDRIGSGSTPYILIGSISLPSPFIPVLGSDFYQKNSGFGYAVAVSDEKQVFIGAYSSPAGFFGYPLGLGKHRL